MGKVPSDRLLVRPITDKEVGKFFVASNGREKPEKGEVMQVGNKVEEFKQGDVIYFGLNAGSNLVIDGERLLLLREPEVLYAE